MKDEKKSFSSKLYEFFHPNKPDAKKEKPFVPNLRSMPKFYIRNFSRILSLNLPMLLLLVPLIVIIFIYTNSGTTPSQESTIYTTLYGSYLYSYSPTLLSMLSIFGQQIDMHVMGVGGIYTCVAMAVVLLLIWGAVHVGATYCARSMFRREPVFVFSDFMYAIKRNWKQGLLMGIIDALVTTILTVDILYCIQVGGTFWLDFMFFAVCALCILYFFMRYYIYLMLVTFDMKLGKIFKNALIFSILGIKRNLMAVLGIVVLLAVNALLFIIFRPFNIVVPLIFPLFYLLPSLTLLQTYGAYPVIEKYMIRTVTGDSADSEPAVEIEYEYDDDDRSVDSEER